MKGHWGSPRGFRECWGHLGGIGGVGVLGVYWGAGRECRYSGARRGIGRIRGYWGLLGV